jgi:hypothetical protein
MFVIREEHLQAQSDRMTDAFVERMVRHLREEFSQYLRVQAVPENDLGGMVRQGMMDAERYGVIYQGDLERYIECMVMLGPAFPRDARLPWAGETLCRDDLDGQAKMDVLSDYVAFEVEALPNE